MKYKGKIGAWWYLMLLIYNLLFIWCFVNYDKLSWALGCIVLLTISDVYLILLTLKNYVIVDNDKITIVLGFSKKEIDCKKIISIKKTNCPIASMAMSFDRIKILYGSECTYISVKDNDKLISHLKKINSDIK
ncbi:MAG: PH domain-containing protein [Lachnospiraceae bacterium]|nr:PH domain-containing protein [Lachnospiraceae bacterium]